METDGRFGNKQFFRDILVGQPADQVEQDVGFPFRETVFFIEIVVGKNDGAGDLVEFEDGYNGRRTPGFRSGSGPRSKGANILTPSLFRR